MATGIDWRTGADGLRLLVRHWSPPASSPDPWATMLLVHGLAEHSGRYEHVGGWLAAAGIDARAIDLRGCGISEGMRGDVGRWTDFEDDVAAGLAEAWLPDRPLALYGHSMGGLIALGGVLDGRLRPDLLVLSAPGLDSAEGALLRTAAMIGARIAPLRRISGSGRRGVLSRDPGVEDRFARDPLRVRSVTVRFAAAAFGAQDRVRREAPQLAALGIPTLILHGSDDRRVPPSASEELGGLSTVTRTVHEGLRHELHNEPEGEAVVSGIVAWLREHVESRPQSNIASGERPTR